MLWDIMITELFPEHIPCFQKCAQSRILRFITVRCIVTNDASRLIGLIITAKHCPCLHAHRSVKCYLMLHHHVDDSGGEHSAHGSAFHDQSFFHHRIPSLK